MRQKKRKDAAVNKDRLQSAGMRASATRSSTHYPAAGAHSADPERKWKERGVSWSAPQPAANHESNRRKAFKSTPDFYRVSFKPTIWRDRYDDRETGQ